LNLDPLLKIKLLISTRRSHKKTNKLEKKLCQLPTVCFAIRFDCPPKWNAKNTSVSFDMAQVPPSCFLVQPFDFPLHPLYWRQHQDLAIGPGG